MARSGARFTYVLAMMNPVSKEVLKDYKDCLLVVLEHLLLVHELELKTSTYASSAAPSSARALAHGVVAPPNSLVR